LPVPAVMVLLAHFVYGMPLPERWLSLVLTASLGLFAFSAIGKIVAAVAGTAQEAMVGVQLLYMPMLILSGVTIPPSALPPWAHALAAFMPATYLVNGLQGMFLRNQTLADHLAMLGALAFTVVAGLFLAVQLFR